MRQATVTRKTRETDIALTLNLDGQGRAEVDTGIGFFNHMLILFAAQSRVDLAVRCQGDLEVDCHHTVEDVGIALGQALAQALGDKAGITRYGDAWVPMDEALVQAVLDISGRPWLTFRGEFSADRVGGFDTQMTEEFFRALAVHGGLTLHLRLVEGRNDHHRIEAAFKAFGRALRQAAAIDPELGGAIPSTKGCL